MVDSTLVQHLLLVPTSWRHLMLIDDLPLIPILLALIQFLLSLEVATCFVVDDASARRGLIILGSNEQIVF